jgi:rsbT co-antagonist protein RsbR
MAGVETIAQLFSSGARLDSLKEAWLRSLVQSGSTSGSTKLSPQDVARQAGEFLALLGPAVRAGGTDTSSSAYAPVREFLESLSRSRASQGFSSAETATFVFSLKQPAFEQLRIAAGSDTDALLTGIWTTTQLLDSLGLHTVKTFQVAREDVIRRQQEEMLELSTPVVKLWDGILALPMVGTLDSARTQVVMESLLNRIVETGSEIAILDITGVPTVDTLVAQHLLKTVTAIRLMGAECIISGVRPQIAQTIVHLGVDLSSVTTKANLADALLLALKRSGYTISR